MKISSRAVKRQLKVQLVCSTDAVFRAKWGSLTTDQQDEQLARAQASL